MFVESTDLDIPPYDLPDLSSSSTFEPFVDMHEESRLEKLLGRKLYEDFIAGLAEVTPAQKWVDLAVGVEYQINDITYKWKGMDKMLIPFIHQQWIKDVLIDSTTSAGVTLAKHENSDVISPSRKVVKSFNDFAMLAGYDKCQEKNTLWGFLWYSGDTYLDSATAVGYTDIQHYLENEVELPGLMNVFNL